jgi:hypothetical protein
MIYIVDGICGSRHPKCSIQGTKTKGQHHHCRGDAVLCTRDAVAVCAKCHSNIMDGWDRFCINRVMAGITSRCLGRVLRDGVRQLHCHIDHLPPKEMKPFENRRRWDQCRIKGCTTFCQIDGVSTRHGTPKPKVV